MRASHISTTHVFKAPMRAPDVQAPSLRGRPVIPENMTVTVHYATLTEPVGVPTSLWVNISGRIVKRDGTVSEQRRTISFGTTVLPQLPDWAWDTCYETIEDFRRVVKDSSQLTSHERTLEAERNRIILKEALR